MARRSLIAIGCLALALHGLGMSRTLLPAQDGLKFIRFAKRYHHEPWRDVVRASDQHPLYSVLIAVAEPPLSLVMGEGPTTWRVAAQSVSVVAALLTLIPLAGLARALFGDRVAVIATLLYVLLPIPAALSRDTLSDSLALLFFTMSLRLGEVALRTGRLSAWLGAGIVAGVGYLARPEILLVPVAVAVTAILSRFVPVLDRIRQGIARPDNSPAETFRPTFRLSPRIVSLMLTCFVIVGSYAIVKGEVSEKLSLRVSGGLQPSARPKPARTPMPPGLDDSRWDFSPKEESSEIAIKGSIGRTLTRLLQQWAEGLSWVLVPLVVWSVARSRTIDGSTVGRRLIAVYLLIFGAVVVRHSTTLGYLSGRHAMTMVVVTIPWAGAGLWAWVRGFPERRRLSPRETRRLAALGLAGLIAIGVSVQIKSMHPSRWGHWAAGRWLLDHANPDDSVLDTRGWATFIRGGPCHDPWHIRQALEDRRLAYVVIGSDELKAKSRRASTYRALLAHAGNLVASFPEREGEKTIGIQIYRFQHPASWGGIQP